MHSESETTRGAAGRPSALIVYEAHVEDTETIVHAVARGLLLEGFAPTTVPVAAAPALRDVHHHLLVVGAPTHAFALSIPRPRADVVRPGAGGARPVTGVRNWLTAVGPGPGLRRPLAAMFDTRVQQDRHLPGSAASRGRHLLQHLGFTVVAPAQGFVVDGLRGAVDNAELGHAVAWGRGLARAYHHQASDTRVVPRT